MKKSKFTEAQIAFALQQSETGVKVEEICRKMGISDATFYVWERNTPDWACARCVSFASWKKKTDSLNSW